MKMRYNCYFNKDKLGHLKIKASFTLIHVRITFFCKELVNKKSNRCIRTIAFISAYFSSHMMKFLKKNEF